MKNEITSCKLVLISFTRGRWCPVHSPLTFGRDTLEKLPDIFFPHNFLVVGKFRQILLQVLFHVVQVDGLHLLHPVYPLDPRFHVILDNFFVSKDKKKFFDKTRNLGIGLNIEFPNQPGTLTFQSGMKSNPLYC